MRAIGRDVRKRQPVRSVYASGRVCAWFGHTGARGLGGRGKRPSVAVLKHAYGGVCLRGRKGVYTGEAKMGPARFFRSHIDRNISEIQGLFTPIHFLLFYVLNVPQP